MQAQHGRGRRAMGYPNRQETFLSKDMISALCELVAQFEWIQIAFPGDQPLFFREADLRLGTLKQSLIWRSCRVKLFLYLRANPNLCDRFALRNKAVL
jgi:hypothetical protein